MTREPVAATEVFKALGDPIRWNIVQQMAQQEELACSVLEDTLPVSKPTISYHTKILTQAGLIEVRKRGRNYFYSLRREVLRSLMDEMWLLAPGPRLVVDGTATGPSSADRPALKAAVGDDTARPAALLTW
ncbi:ArsR/SmtB family transcription factor [Trujillonella endophytica]|uniref:DNA-binding transcriptional regulator, ArsR family n=1 Tax=Trujillonella endophytica TaxID=673521 RepID=A0A1H8W8M1_9ACTN|nr:metalloregulator ArsR/SmtB family transcription factor [Trujillella endophytica]SEP23488.1 DNA-binding transcriptional regulator, ArsR family [Trujillella endophytica]